MRASAVRTAIKSAIEAITPDTKYHQGDLFRVLEPERLLMTADPYAIQFEIIVNFSNSPGVSDRMLDDCDLIVDALLDLPVTNSQILQVKIQGNADIVDETGNRASSFSLVVFYDRRNPT